MMTHMSGRLRLFASLSFST